MPVGFGSSSAHRSTGSRAGVLALLLVAGSGVASANGAADPQPAAAGPRVPGVESEVYVTGMTFVASRPDRRDFVLEARRATLRPESNVAELFDAKARVTEGTRGRAFDVYCDRGELDLTSNDFLAEGNVHGSSAEGQRYAAPWVRYETARGLLYTDAPVVLRDGAGTFRGDGFRYHVSERRFELLGNVSVVHAP
jgi:LPS export ABC transporter protein LptC